ncbi:N-acetyltransferase [Tabrizicola sp.]|uniref:N-acetyltransferase n=1 Tax=Tabrizicola sp. TaxID=2005166 RepID=UPI001A54B2DD|nr:N-acetyltransferase [Tabrizicola sp.]MBL9073512.1 N-acetyltransferase [Tabrizicola sp.]
MRDEVFGSDDQRALLRRGRSLAALLGHDRRYSYYGRSVGLPGPEDGDIDHLAALAIVQGSATYLAVPLDQVEAIKASVVARGLVPMVYDRWDGSDLAIAAARRVVATCSLPDDVTMQRLDASSAEGHLASLAEMALGCGVLPPCGEVLRGLLRPAVCLVAIDRSSKVVSCAASSAYAHQDHPRQGRKAWWGMLATDMARRGQKLSLILGAHALLEMESRFGFGDFMTGVEPGNAPSEAICARMGLAKGQSAVIGCTDLRALASGRMTK